MQGDDRGPPSTTGPEGGDTPKPSDNGRLESRPLVSRAAIGLRNGRSGDYRPQAMPALSPMLRPPLQMRKGPCLYPVCGREHFLTTLSVAGTIGCMNGGRSRTVGRLDRRNQRVRVALALLCGPLLVAPTCNPPPEPEPEGLLGLRTEAGAVPSQLQVGESVDVLFYHELPTWIGTEAPGVLAASGFQGALVFGGDGPALKINLLSFGPGWGSEAGKHNGDSLEISLIGGAFPPDPQPLAILRVTARATGTATIELSGNEISKHPYLDDWYSVTGLGETSLLATIEVVPPLDSDSDGILDPHDNCPNVPNGPDAPDAGAMVQYDVDADGVGNLCDGDFDQDGLVTQRDHEVLLECLGMVIETARGPIEDPSCAESDLDGDLDVDRDDFARFGALMEQGMGL